MKDEKNNKQPGTINVWGTGQHRLYNGERYLPDVGARWR